MTIPIYEYKTLTERQKGKEKLFAEEFFTVDSQLIAIPRFMNRRIEDWEEIQTTLEELKHAASNTYLIKLLLNNKDCHFYILYGGETIKSIHAFFQT